MKEVLRLDPFHFFKFMFSDECMVHVNEYGAKCILKDQYDNRRVIESKAHDISVMIWGGIYCEILEFPDPH
jgi:hypothetical protein